MRATRQLRYAATAVGLAVVLLSGSGASQARWVDTEVIAGAQVTTGRLNLENLATSVAISPAGGGSKPAGDSLRPGDTVTVTSSATLALEGDALEADLSLAVDGLLAPDGTVPPGRTVSVTLGQAGLPVDQATGAGIWRVTPQADGASVTLTVVVPISSTTVGVSGASVSWALTQVGPAGGWYADGHGTVALPGVEQPQPEPTLPVINATPVPGGSDNKLFTISWASDLTETAATKWQILRRTGTTPWTVVETLPSGSRTFTITDDMMKDISAPAVADFMIRVLPTGSGQSFDSAQAIRMEALSGTSGRMKFVGLVPVDGVTP